jgi:hypothetical protein
MGNSSTVDFFCGKDPDFSVVHDEDEPDKHYPGCGLEIDYCTVKEC